jgi:hypothetical protein
MQLQYWAAMIRLECGSSRSESAFDDRQSEFQTLVNLLGQLVRQLSSPEAVGANGCIGFEISYLPIACFVALRCRNPCIRREAISLLRTPLPTEEQWSRGKMLADVAEFIMALEEAAAMTPVPLSCQDIPHTSRLHLLSCSFFSYDRAAHRYQMWVSQAFPFATYTLIAIVPILPGIPISSNVA